MKAADRSSPGKFSYIVGNTLVLTVGFLAAYATLALGHAASPELLDPRTSDFLQYFSVGRVVLHGHAADMYRWYPMLHVEQAIAYPYLVPVRTVQPSLIYPPFTALAFTPFAALPYDGARLVWFVLSAAGLSSALYLLSRTASLSMRADLIMRLATFVSLPLLQTFREGQVTVFLLLALLGAFYYSTRGNALPAGVCLAAFTVKPQYAVPIVLVLVVQRHWNILVSFVGSVAVLLAVPTLFFGLDTLSRYLGSLEALRHGGPMFNSPSESMYGLAQELLPRGLAVPIWAFACLLVTVLLVWYAWRSPSLELPFALAVVTALLISPHLLLHELLLILLPAAVLLREAHARNVKVGWPLAAVYIGIAAAVPLQLFIPVRVTTFAIAGLGLLLLVVSRLPHAVRASSGPHGTGAPAEDSLLLAVSGHSVEQA